MSELAKANEESTPEPFNIVETQHDVTALRAMSLHAKRMPVPLIAQQMNVSPRTIRRYIQHARELLKEDPVWMIHDFLAMNDDLIRETWIRFQNLERNEELKEPTKESVRAELLQMVNNLMRTRWEAIKALAGVGEKSVTATILKTAEGFAMQLKEEPKSVKTLMDEIEAEAKAKAQKTVLV